MQEIYDDGSMGPVTGLTPGQELMEVLRAIQRENVKGVRVGRRRDDDTLDTQATIVRGKAKLRPHGYKEKKRRKRKIAKKSRKKNRRY